jgi:hypothetical protein
MKRSSQVALLLMGTVAVGGLAYTAMPSEECKPGVVQPDGQLSQKSQNCSHSSRRGGSGGGGSWRSSSSSSSSSSNSSQYFSSEGRTGSSSSGDHGSSSVSRGGFGSFASHFSGGG